MVRNCRQTYMLLAIATCCISAACQRDDSVSEPPVSEMRSSLKLLIQLGNSMISELGFRVTRRGQLVRSGTFLIDGNQKSFSALVGALQSAEQYVLTLSGMTTNPQSGAPQTCSAIAAFNMASGVTTVLGVLVRCEDQLRAPGPTAGDRALPDAASNSSAGVPAAPGSTSSDTGSSSSDCARIDAVRAVPGEAPIGKSVVLKSDMRLSDDPAVVPKFAWSADTGMVTDEGAGRSIFTCTETGVATVVLSLRDSRPLCSEERVFVYVTCFGVGSSAQPAGAGSRS